MASRKSKISILVCGRTGVGKSTLVNGILGKDVCKVGDPGDYIDCPERAFRPQTSVVGGFSGVMNGVDVTVYDSPGLQDGTDNDQQYLDDMYEKCHDVDLVIYCHDITRTRWTEDEIQSIRLITDKFGATFWNKTVLVFTKANLLQPARLKDDDREYLEKMVGVNGDKFRFELKEVLQAQQSDQFNPSTIVDRLPAVPAGSERQQILPTGPFIGNLWITCMERLRYENTAKFMRATSYEERALFFTEVKDGQVISPTKKDLDEAWWSKRGKTKSAGTVSEQTVPKYILYIDKKNTERFKTLIDKCRKYALEFWSIVSSELKMFIPPVED